MEHLISWRTGAAGHTVARQTDPLALPAGAVVDSFLRIADRAAAGAGAAARSSSLSVDLWGRRAQHPALDRTLMGLRRAFAPSFRAEGWST